MLVLTRKAGETVMIGDGIRVTISAVSGNRVKIAVDAPRECKIRRKEVPEAAHDAKGIARSQPASKELMLNRSSAEIVVEAESHS